MHFDIDMQLNSVQSLKKKLEDSDVEKDDQMVFIDTDSMFQDEQGLLGFFFQPCCAACGILVP